MSSLGNISFLKWISADNLHQLQIRLPLSSGFFLFTIQKNFL